MHKLINLIKSILSPKNHNAVLFARASTGPKELTYKKLALIDQMSEMQKALGKLNTDLMLVKEPNNLNSMSTDEFNKYFAYQVQKLLDIWTTRNRSTSIKASPKPSLTEIYRQSK